MGRGAWNDKNRGLVAVQQGSLPGLYRRKSPARMAFSRPQPDNIFGLLILEDGDSFRSCGNRAHESEEGAIRLVASHRLL